MIDINACIEKLPYWDKLTAEERDFVRSRSAIRQYKRGQNMHSQDSACLGMILVLEGEARAYILSEEGREITLFRLHAGEPCVLSASCVISRLTFDTHIVAETGCTVLVIGPDAFSSLTDRNIYVRCVMYELATEHFSAVMASMQQILFMRYDRRLAMFLLEEHERTNSREIRMTHERIAQNTSSAREVVARTLKRFSTQGFVELRRGSIMLKDIGGLKKIVS